MDKPMELPTYMPDVLDRLHTAGFAAYVVGGAVRDALMGGKPHDFDVTTSALPSQVKAIFEAAGHTVVETGLAHGTVTVLYDKTPIEITTFRVEGSYHDTRHPDNVSFTDRLELDLSRRDFTVNAIAYTPGEGYIDQFGGMDDIRHGVIRCIGDPHARFGEDALRILRALRFSAVLGFDLEAQTAVAAIQNAPLLKHISAERHTAEFEKMFLSAHPERLNALMLSHRAVLEEVLPELATLSENEYAVLCQRTVSVPGENGLRAVFFLAQSGHTEALLSHLRFSTLFASRVRKMRASYEEARAVQTRIQARFLLSRFGETACIDAATALAATGENAVLLPLVKEILSAGDCASVAQLAVDGNMLLASGLSGKQIGTALSLLLNEVMSDRLPNEKEALLGYLKNAAFAS